MGSYEALESKLQKFIELRLDAFSQRVKVLEDLVEQIQSGPKRKRHVELEVVAEADTNAQGHSGLRGAVQVLADLLGKLGGKRKDQVEIETEDDEGQDYGAGLSPIFNSSQLTEEIDVDRDLSIAVGESVDCDLVSIDYEPVDPFPKGHEFNVNSEPSPNSSERTEDIEVDLDLTATDDKFVDRDLIYIDGQSVDRDLIYIDGQSVDRDLTSIDGESVDQLPAGHEFNVNSEPYPNASERTEEIEVDLDLTPIDEESLDQFEAEAEHEVDTTAEPKLDAAGSKSNSNFVPNSNCLKSSSVNSGSQKHECAYCKKSFAFHSEKVVHERVHTGEKPYSCPVCARPFSQKANCDAHVRTHTNAKCFDCRLCETAFAHKSTFKRHLKSRKHGKMINSSK